jgi:hypothetical protein
MQHLSGGPAQRPNYHVLYETLASMKRNRGDLRLMIEQSNKMVADARVLLARVNALSHYSCLRGSKD